MTVSYQIKRDALIIAKTKEKIIKKISETYLLRWEDIKPCIKIINGIKSDEISKEIP
jgi:hypothetical protein